MDSKMLRTITFTLCVALCYAGPSNKKVRPCRLNDYKCIQDNIAANSNCNKNIKGYSSSEFVIPEFRFETPYFNASYVDTNSIIRNFDKAYVSEFFFDMESDTSILTVDYPNLWYDLNRTLIQHTTGEEDTSYSFRFNGVYPLIRVTVHLKHANKLDLCSAFAFADVTALPIYKIDPNDKPTANFLSRDLSFLNIYERESFAYRAGPIIRQFVNERICDFGC